MPAALPDNALATSLSARFAQIPAAWQGVTAPFAGSAPGQALQAFVDQRVQGGATVYPATPFRALELTAPAEVRIVILGQDPYHGPGQAQGLAFSVAPGQRPPPSLRNMLAEVRSDTGAASICHDDLTPWAEQGVLLLNSVLTVEDGAPQSHAGRGWELLTDALLVHVAAGPAPVVFMLWGAAAQRKRALLEAEPGVEGVGADRRHAFLVANHPSPLSARRLPVPFIGNRPFTRANAVLAALRPGTAPVQW
jgi:uracil-DNA glycosylase